MLLSSHGGNRMNGRPIQVEKFMGRPHEAIAEAGSVPPHGNNDPSAPSWPVGDGGFGATAVAREVPSPSSTAAHAEWGGRSDELPYPSFWNQPAGGLQRAAAVSQTSPQVRCFLQSSVLLVFPLAS